jgi:hypothetical protein
MSPLSREWKVIRAPTARGAADSINVERYRLDGEGQQLGAGFMAEPSVKERALSAADLARVNP